MNLYDIANEYRQAFDELSEMEGITKEIIDDTLSHLEIPFNNKVESTACFLKNLEADVFAIKNVEKKMKNKKDRLEEIIYETKEYLKNQMITAKKSKIKFSYFSVVVSKTKKRVLINDISKVPESFIRTKIIKEVDKDCIREAGGCEGAEIRESWALKIK